MRKQSQGTEEGAKERLDMLLVARGLAGSRSRAKEMILAGEVYVDGRKVCKAGTFCEAEGADIRVLGQELRYVSRGGLKLEKALREWQIGLEDKICMDIGASTGGFTDCMLQNGAARVYALDVGRNQLAEKLKNDKRVVCMEQKNFRYMTQEELPEEPEFVSADVSFISLTKILIPAIKLMKSGGQLVCLVKPQFEAGRGKVGKNGVVKDAATHRQVLGRVVDYADLIGFQVAHLTFSPIRGPEGNIEYLLHLEKGEQTKEIGALLEREAQAALEELCREGGGLSCGPFWERLIKAVVVEAHNNL
mgnify:FL=1